MCAADSLNRLERGRSDGTIEPEQERYLAEISARSRSADGLGRKRVAAEEWERDWGDIDTSVISEDAEVTVGEHAVSIRRYRVPGEESSGSEKLVYVHGGGWVLGGLDSHDGFCRALAKATGMESIAVEYRLAPEHPFPAALEDVRAVLQDLSTPGSPIVLAGDSAGGNLVAVVAASAEFDLSAQILIYPVIDLSFESSLNQRMDEYGLSASDLEWYRERYVPDHLLKDPRVSPIHGDPSKSPPTLVVAAGLDPLVGQATSYAELLAASGVRTRLVIYHGAVHGFVGWAKASPMARGFPELLADDLGWLMEAREGR